MSNSAWSDAQKIGDLWYKFKQNSDGRWEILSSGDPNSLERNSVVSHDHYWERNGRWYCQVKVGHQHLMHRDDFIADIQRQQERNSLNLTGAEKQEINLNSGCENALTSHQVKKLADYRARQAYGNSGYGGRDLGVEVSPYEAEVFQRLIREHQSTSTASNLNWRDTKSTASSLNCRDSKSTAKRNTRKSSR